MENENKEIPKEEAVPKLIELVDRLEKANAEAKEILARQQEIAALNLLGGKTDAGMQQTKPKEETPEEYSKRILSGRL